MGRFRKVSCPDCDASFSVPVFGGRFTFFNKQPVYCDDCVATKIQAQEKERKVQELQLRCNEAIEADLLTEQFRTASFSESSKEIEAGNPEAWKSARKWTGRDNLYICGGVGTGKTFMALCALRWHFDAGRTVAEVTARRFTKVIDRFDEGRGMLAAWKKADVLLLDDIDKAQWTLDRIDGLWDLLNARMSAGRRSILTGNVSLPALVTLMRENARNTNSSTISTARVDAALERLKPVTVIEMTGGSLRAMSLDQ